MTSNFDASPGLQPTDTRVCEKSGLKEHIISFHKSVVRSCRNEFTLQDARNVVPLAELVQNNLDILDGDYQDNLLPVLTHWFSNEFFAWFNPPACERCNEQLISQGTRANPEGLLVEVYGCGSTSCNYTFDFIRHNDPAILLHTRRGRCGEWANCFFVILKAMDYDVRIVLDTTDHVWNEVWSESRQEWIHVDPCENVVDCPLLYELGWSKKLEYCIAFSKYEVIDVTRRYSMNINAVRKSRYPQSFQGSPTQDLWLTKFLHELTVQATEGLDQDTRALILKRRSIDMKHLEDFEIKGRPKVDLSKIGGRKTGDVAWRIARGEYRPILTSHNVITIKRCADGSGHSIFTLQYDCDKDMYTCSSKDLSKKGWQELIYLAENIDHKFERDWSTSYLARYESCAPTVEGKVQWRFDLSSVQDWARIEIRIVAKTWPDTALEAKLVCVGDDESDRATQELKLNEINILTAKHFGSTRVTSIDLKISLIGGQIGDSVAWQKPQLFRQVRGQASGSSFLFEIFDQNP